MERRGQGRFFKATKTVGKRKERRDSMIDAVFKANLFVADQSEKKKIIRSLFTSSGGKFKAGITKPCYLINPISHFP